VPARSGAARAFQHQLPAHELAVVLAHRPLGGSKAGVRREGALGPFPDIAKYPAAGLWDDRPGRVELVADRIVRVLSDVFPYGLGR
jgi:hypothetical protein